MTQDPADEAKKLIVGDSIEWIKRFDVNEYIKNKPMIEKLYEEKQLALTASYHLETRVKELDLRIHELELQHQKSEIHLQELSRKSFITFLLALLATVLVGTGVNIATSKPSEWTGWAMVIAGCILQVISFFLISSASKDK